MILLMMGLTLTAEASDPWTDASHQDLMGFVRAASLDIRGHVPSLEELHSIEDAGELPEGMLDEWLNSSAFETQVIERHRELMWNSLEVTLLQRRRLGRRNGIYFNNNRATHTRGLAQTHCGTEPANVDEFNRPLTWTINDDGGIEEGYVWVEPYWNPGTSIQVCAFDAQTVPVSANGVDCSTEDAHQEADCGCGPNLQWCFDNTTEAVIEDALSYDLNERVRAMLQSDSGYEYLLNGQEIFLNGASTHFFRHLVPFDVDTYQRPVPTADLPEIDFTDEAWYAVALDDHHDGILTSPGWLLRHQTNRGRANRFYGGFLCQEFLPTNNEITTEASLVAPSPNLILREGCQDCHARLEPWGAYWGRWAEASMVFYSPLDFPAYSEECAQCALTTGVCSDVCEDFYLVEPNHSDELPYVGWLNTYAFLVDNKQEHPDLGPLGWVNHALENGDLSECAVQRAGEWLLNWSENDSVAEADWSAQFSTSMSYRRLVKDIVTSPQYWKGEE